MVLVIVFSFYGYSDEYDDESTKEDQKGGEDEYANPNQKTMKHLEKHYMKSGTSNISYFNDEADASQSFETECIGQYHEFQTRLRNLFAPKIASGRSLPSPEYGIDQIQSLQQQCKEIIKSNYGHLYRNIERKLHSLKMNPNLKYNLEQIISVFYKIPNTFNGADVLKEFFVNLNSFKNCITAFFEQDLYGNYHLNKPLEDALIGLKDRCFEARKEVENFIKIEDGLWQHLVNLPGTL